MPTRHNGQRRDITADLVRDALSFISPDIGHDERARIAFSVFHGLGDAGADVWQEWAGRRSNADEAEDRSTWRSARKPGAVTIGTLLGMAKDRGFKLSEADAAAPAPDPAALAAAAAERERKRDLDAAQYRERADQAARVARQMWADANDEGLSPYLERKGVQAHGVRFLPDGTLLVPLHDADGELQNVQRIAPNKPAGDEPEKRFLPGGRKSGLFHLIGATSEAPPVLLLAEGYATAASLHEATGQPVAVCFDAGNLKACVPSLRALYPAALLLVCGDDDRATEARTGTNPGRVKAAAAVRAAITDTGRAACVFPDGLADGASDFNDLAAHAGAGVVRAQVEAAILAACVDAPAAGTASPSAADQPAAEATPAPAPKKRAKARAPQAAEGDQADGDIAGGPDEFGFHVVTDGGESGVWFTLRKPDGTTGRPQWLCAPLHILARTRNEAGDGYGRLIRFNNCDGITKTWALPDRMLTADGAEWFSTLRDMGLETGIDAKSRAMLAQYINTRRPDERVICTEKVGWHGGGAYVLPDSRVIRAPNGQRYIFQSENGLENTFSQGGNFDAWRMEVAQRCIGNSRLVLALCCAFAGPVFELLRIKTSIVHLTGNSSAGKTTALLLAASVNGSPKYKQQWRATDNHVEGTCVQHNNALLVLDEVGQLDSKLAGEIAYLICNQMDKGRATRGPQLRRRREWNLVTLSSGEKDMAELMHEAGKKPAEGQMVRFLSIPADAGAGLGMLEDLHDFVDGKLFAEAIEKAAARHHGQAGSKWIEWLSRRLASSPGELEAEGAELMLRFEALAVPESAHPQVRRVGTTFAALAAAGELATRAGLTGWADDESLQQVARCFAAWLAKRGHSGNGEKYAQLAQVKNFLEKNGEALFSWIDRFMDDHNKSTPFRAGFRRFVDESGAPVRMSSGDDCMPEAATSMERDRIKRKSAVQYLVMPEAFKRDVCKGHDPEAVARMLNERGHLLPESGRLTNRQRLPGMGGEKAAVYIIKPSIFADEFEEI